MSKLSTSTRELGAWFERQKRVLPWRSEPSVYRVWISEIMLQQTQVVAVIPFFERFVARFPTVESLALAPEADVLAHWAGLGYYSRARNIHKAAKQIVAGGRFPRTREEWLEIPGVGQYTAGAILSISQDAVEAILDGNVERVLARLRLVSRTRGDAAYKERLWRLSRLFVETGAAAGVKPSVLNQALMELGATVCVPRSPRCGQCPLERDCRARSRSAQDKYPPRKKPKEWLKVHEKLQLVIASDVEGERVLLRRRRAGEWRAGLWDLLEELPSDLAVASLGSVETRHVVTRHKITRETGVWRARKPAKRAAVADAMDEEFRWVALEELLGKSGEIAAGSALKRTLIEAGRKIPGLYQSSR